MTLGKMLDQLGNYVYALLDPRNGEVFYVSAGKGMDVLEHRKNLEKDQRVQAKLRRLREIAEAGYVAETFYVRHGLDEETALEISAAVQDVVGLRHLTNLGLGRQADLYGLFNFTELEGRVSPAALNTDLPLILVNVGEKYPRRMNEIALYETTRIAARSSVFNRKAQYVVPVYAGVTLTVYKIDGWEEGESHRWEFIGHLAEEDIVFDLVRKSVKSIMDIALGTRTQHVNC